MSKELRIITGNTFFADHLTFPDKFHYHSHIRMSLFESHFWNPSIKYLIAKSNFVPSLSMNCASQVTDIQSNGHIFDYPGTEIRTCTTMTQLMHSKKEHLSNHICLLSAWTGFAMCEIGTELAAFLPSFLLPFLLIDHFWCCCKDERFCIMSHQCSNHLTMASSHYFAKARNSHITWQSISCPDICHLVTIV